ncbi:hypothetical protein B0H17DRAFT_1210544 [Mycena rosella]|uniref:phosphoribosylglycinamide formyltransferase 1 n=1 Tax=Mycena rosella TaxID=1033263 RepID=A0AAD7G8M5_MYCRO|nr:hypothetical protein B0H17DRAFT_1210544 [Mycena rosella]
MSTFLPSAGYFYSPSATPRVRSLVVALSLPLPCHGVLKIFSIRDLNLLPPSLLDLHNGAGVPVITIHPALPGAFDGTNAIERAYEAFEMGEIAHSGAMVHRVVKDVDRGEPPAFAAPPPSRPPTPLISPAKGHCV